MKTYTERLMELSKEFSFDEMELVEQMIHSAADYVQQVAIMESTRLNFAGRNNEEYRNKLSETDTARTKMHNALISATNIVNRRCEAHGLPPIYTGPKDVRRSYGDFAIELVDEIFKNRL